MQREQAAATQRQGTALRSPKNKFTMTEDKLLSDLVKQFGTNNTWEYIASLIPNRNARQCHDRWFYYLSPDVNKGPWTEEEDNTLKHLVATMGPHWVKISKQLQGRTDTQVKNRWNVLQRRLKADRKTQNVYQNYFNANNTYTQEFNYDTLIPSIMEHVQMNQRQPSTYSIPVEAPKQAQPEHETVTQVAQQIDPLFNFDDGFLNDSIFDSNSFDIFNTFE